MACFSDSYLATIPLEKYRLLSVDIFDTLLFRTCSNPEDIFLRVGRRLSEEHSLPYAPETYQALRQEAAERARRHALQTRGTSEYKFGEIFDEMPTVFRDGAKLELAAEHEAVFLNPNMMDLIQQAQEKGLVIALLSDMYLSAKQLLGLLEEAGMDTALVDCCLSSCDVGKGKASGGLFAALKAKYPHIPATAMVHIGDRTAADVDGAAKEGIQGFLYPVVPRPVGNLYDVEENLYGADLGELSSLRKLAAASRPRDIPEENWQHFTIGAEIIGPIYALFSDWLVDCAQENDIHTILPLMREGELLAHVISRAAQGRDFVCQPFFASRLPVFIASIDKENYSEKLAQHLLKTKSTIGQLLEDIGLCLNNLPVDLQIDLDTLWGDVSQRQVGRDIVGWLQSASVQTKVLAYANTQRALLLEALAPHMAKGPCLTVDVGVRGTTESLLHDILSRQFSHPAMSHALMMGSAAHGVANIMAGVPIVAWLGIAGENKDRITRLMNQIQVLEPLINANCGTLLRYKRDDDTGKPQPFLDMTEEKSLRSNRPAVQACWRGVEVFQELWLMLKEEKSSAIASIITRHADLLSIWLRFIEMPTAEEAAAVGQMVYYDRFYQKNAYSLLGKALPTNISDQDIETVLAEYGDRDTLWPQGTVSLAKPSFFTRQYIKNSSSQIPFVRQMAEIIVTIQQENERARVAIYAAGQRGQDFCRLALAMGLDIQFFVDSNKALHEKTVAGKPVRDLATIKETDIDVYVISALRYAKEITETIAEKYLDSKTKPRIFSF